jgi:hypothetical protein
MAVLYEIHSLHINVGNGDAAIHLLVEPVTDAKNVVHRAILVDGGKTTAVDQIVKTIKYIEDTYAIVDLDGTNQVDQSSTAKPPPPQLRFDGIVVTKWAVDHSAGLLKLINDQLLADKPDPKVDRKSNNGLTRLGPCSFMRYDAKTQAPLTNIYSAFWEGTGASKLEKTTTTLAPTSQIRLTSPNGTDPSPPFAIGAANRSADFIDSADQTKRWIGVFNLVATRAELIGRELFTGQIAANTPVTNVWQYDDVGKLVTAVSALPAFAAAPTPFTGICCIGADGMSISGTATSTISTISLAGIVGGAVKHYFAGDADYSDGEFLFLAYEISNKYMKVES